MKFLTRFAKLVLFLVSVAFFAFWSWVMWDHVTDTQDTRKIEIPNPNSSWPSR
jgi:hypothetical protein